MLATCPAILTLPMSRNIQALEEKARDSCARLADLFQPASGSTSSGRPRGVRFVVTWSENAGLVVEACTLLHF